MTKELTTPTTSLPFPFNQQNFCRYEPVSQSIDEARVLVIDNLLRDERDLSSVARAEGGETLAAEMRRERLIAGMAVENILNNISRLVKSPTTEVAHLSEVATAAKSFAPDAIVLSGTNMMPAPQDCSTRGQRIFDGAASRLKLPIQNVAAPVQASPIPMRRRGSTPRVSRKPISGTSAIVNSPAGERIMPACIGE